MSHHSACIKTNGFKASDLSMPRAGSVIKQFVSRHQITSWACFKTNGFRASDPSETLTLGTHKNKWHAATAWQLCGESCCGYSGKDKYCMATAWQLHGNCAANLAAAVARPNTEWQLHGNCMAKAWQLLGNCVVNA